MYTAFCSFVLKWLLCSFAVLKKRCPLILNSRNCSRSLFCHGFEYRLVSVTQVQFESYPYSYSAGGCGCLNLGFGVEHLTTTENR